jgi:hypothetical protein
LGLVLWDVVAVSRWGPLRYLVHGEQVRKARGLPPLLPSGMEWRGATFDLGTGDLVLFAVTVGRGVGAGPLPAAATCLGVLAGVASTVVVALWLAPPGPGGTPVTLPALPGSLLFGTIAYFGSRHLLEPYVQATVVTQGLYF